MTPNTTQIQTVEYAQICSDYSRTQAVLTEATERQLHFCWDQAEQGREREDEAAETRVTQLYDCLDQGGEERSRHNTNPKRKN